ncbi:phenylacetate-CoA oxygenase subunit PaaC [Streptomyces sp. NBC_01341]|uniref:1,2-phenylacetyl-CoA epoxidase subunit PaaC n=1 Tax=Streptomyces sp. NBC_01341 TaxID=2903831 RepID=UPI002E131886|nr:phenylacetate-CoA oxygenase subunit PaaC [Streptomyces sp. NBC_01341]
MTAALALGDDALVLSHRLGEWAGHAPVLEEEVALANIALDLLGQARMLLSFVGDEDELAFLREERAFRNVQLVEQPNGDFAHTIARQLYFSVYQHCLYAQLASGEGEFADLAAKAVKEVAYHRDHAEQWVLRLGDGTAESHDRMQLGLDALWKFTGELFEPVEGVDVEWQALRDTWLAAVTAVVEQATLTLPSGPQSGAWAAGAGRQGLHTEPFGRMLAEMQHLHRSHPGASW